MQLAVSNSRDPSMPVKPIMKNHMEKKMENDMETVVRQGF